MRAKRETGESDTFCLLVICQEEILKANAVRDGELDSLRGIRRLVSSYTSSSEPRIFTRLGLPWP